jgi:hypothetical protein
MTRAGATASSDTGAIERTRLAEDSLRLRRAPSTRDHHAATCARSACTGGDGRLFFFVELVERLLDVELRGDDRDEDAWNGCGERADGGPCNGVPAHGRLRRLDGWGSTFNGLYDTTAKAGSKRLRGGSERDDLRRAALTRKAVRSGAVHALLHDISESLVRSGPLALLAPTLLAACASLSSLDDYLSCKTNCPGALEGGAVELADATPDDALTSTDAPGTSFPEDASSLPEDAQPGDAPCEGASCVGPASDAAGACAKGSCNRAGGACLASAPCYCARDRDCLSGQCVVAPGKNDVSCGSSCTGTGAADGFQCMLGGSGFPASCSASSFAYTPSGLTSSQLSGVTPSAAVDLSCAGTVTFDGSTWSGATCSQGLPAPHTFAQSGGPSIDVLAFQSLTIASGVSVSFTGTNAVVILVFGDASVAGSIHADGTSGMPSRSSPGASGPGGGSGCASSAGAPAAAGTRAEEEEPGRRVRVEQAPGASAGPAVLEERRSPARLCGAAVRAALAAIGRARLPAAAEGGLCRSRWPAPSPSRAPSPPTADRAGRATAQAEDARQGPTTRSAAGVAAEVRAARYGSRE